MRYFMYRVLLATIRDKGNCPCPRCLVVKSDIAKLGHKIDIQNRVSKARSYLSDTIKLARSFIYEQGRKITSKAVEQLLKSKSWVPTLVSLL